MFISSRILLVALIVSIGGDLAVESIRGFYKLEKSEEFNFNEILSDNLDQVRKVQRRETASSATSVSSANSTRTGLPVQFINHTYYTSAHYQDGSNLFVDVRKLHEQNNTNAFFHEYLTNSYGRVHSRKLKFKFPFYGHEVDSVRIATGGFLHIGPVFHSFITETQYVAPLMANFNPKVKTTNGTRSKIFLYDDGSRFITQWDSVILDDQRIHGQFTFQVSIFKNGSIVFAYKSVPVPLASISTSKHPVRVGLSDAFIFTRKVGDYTHRRIYRYHVVNLDRKQVLKGSAFQVHPVPSCITAKSCNECLSSTFEGFTCAWCDKLSLCSDTLDWHRQAWYDAGCSIHAYKEASKCFASKANSAARKRRGRKSHVSPAVVSGSIFVALLLVILISAAGMYLYAHTHPNTRAGLYIIEHGPRTWFRKKDSSNC